METTRRLIEQSRGQAVRLQDIARESGVSRQAIYLHFDSRVGLMVATVQHVDEVAGFVARTQHICNEEDGLVAVDLFVDFWAEYLPSIYGLAKQLLILRNTDEGAAAAWRDRMDGLRNGPCRFLVERLEVEGHLDLRWQTETAIDILWTLASVQTWENLVLGCGWSNEQYAVHLKHMIKCILTNK